MKTLRNAPARLDWIRQGVLVLFCLYGVTANAGEWSADYAGTLRQAAAQKKLVLVNFTGSDWCPYCIKLHNEVFNKPEFAAYVDGRYLLVEVDFPRKKALPAQQKQVNDALAQRFGIEGYPTVLVLNGAGKQVGKLGYYPGGSQSFLSELKRQAGDSTPLPAKAAVSAPAPVAPAAKAAVAAPTLPTDLVLRGIIGSKQNAMAIVNNKTLAKGEEATIKLDGRDVRVRCLEIREGAVSVSVDGAKEPRELRLAVSR